MKRIFTIWTLSICSLFLFNSAYADHLPGSYITVRYSGSNNIYIVKVVYYRECLALPAPSMISIYYSIIGNTPSTLNIPILSSATVPISSCTPNGMTTCAQGTGIDGNIYETSITLLQPGIYRFYNDVCCRGNIGVTGNTAPAYAEAILDLQTAPLNSLPDFITPPEFYFCLNNPSNYHCMASDNDGDSMVYSLIPGLDNTNGTPVAISYTMPYSHLNFVSSSSPITFSALTGTASFTPNQMMNGLVVYKVDEYRNGTFIGSIMRETRIQITPGVVGINEMNHHTVNIFPNPVQDQIQISSSSKIKSWMITDLSGRPVKEANDFTNDGIQSINVNEIPDGLYILQLNNENGTSFNRFVKQ